MKKIVRPVNKRSTKINFNVRKVNEHFRERFLGWRFSLKEKFFCILFELLQCFVIQYSFMLGCTHTHRQKFYSIILFNSSFAFFRELLLFLKILIPLSWYLSTYFSYFNSLYLLFIFLWNLFILGSCFSYFLQSKKLYFLNFKLRFNTYYFNCYFFFAVFFSLTVFFSFPALFVLYAFPSILKCYFLLPPFHSDFILLPYNPHYLPPLLIFSLTLNHFPFVYSSHFNFLHFHLFLFFVFLSFPHFQIFPNSSMFSFSVTFHFSSQSRFSFAFSLPFLPFNLPLTSKLVFSLIFRLSLLSLSFLYCLSLF